MLVGRSPVGDRIRALIMGSDFGLATWTCDLDLDSQLGLGRLAVLAPIVPSLRQTGIRGESPASGSSRPYRYPVLFLLCHYWRQFLLKNKARSTASSNFCRYLKRPTHAGGGAPAGAWWPASCMQTHSDASYILRNPKDLAYPSCRRTGHRGAGLARALSSVRD